MNSLSNDQTVSLTIPEVNKDVSDALKMRAIAERFPDRNALIRALLDKAARPYIPLLTGRENTSVKESD